MAITIISTLKQANNQSFPLVDSNDIKGGLYQVNTKDEMLSIPEVRLKDGMLVWISAEGIYYQYSAANKTWSALSLSGGGSTDIAALKEHLKLQIDKNTINLLYDDTVINTVSVKLVGDYDYNTGNMTIDLVSSEAPESTVQTYWAYNKPLKNLAIDNSICSYDSESQDLTLNEHNEYSEGDDQLTID